MGRLLSLIIVSQNLLENFITDMNIPLGQDCVNLVLIFWQYKLAYVTVVSIDGFKERASQTKK